MGYLFLISCFQIGNRVHVETFDEKQKQACVEKKPTSMYAYEMRENICSFGNIFVSIPYGLYYNIVNILDCIYTKCDVNICT